MASSAQWPLMSVMLPESTANASGTIATVSARASNTANNRFRIFASIACAVRTLLAHYTIGLPV